MPYKCLCQHHHSSTEGWEATLDQKWYLHTKESTPHVGEYVYTTVGEEIKSFIHSLLTATRKEERKKEGSLWLKAIQHLRQDAKERIVTIVRTMKDEAALINPFQE